jgi:hypothetical protein
LSWGKPQLLLQDGEMLLQEGEALLKNSDPVRSVRRLGRLRELTTKQPVCEDPHQEGPNLFPGAAARSARHSVTGTNGSHHAMAST